MLALELVVAVLAVLAIAAAAAAVIRRSVREPRERAGRTRRRAGDLDDAPAGTTGAGRDAAVGGRTAEELLSVADSTGLGLVRLDAELIVRVANDAAHSVLGRPPGRLVGLTAMEAFGDHLVEELARSAIGDGGRGAEVTTHGANPRSVLVRARPASGGAWIALQDVSELRRLERIRAEFVDNLSHELRTPLTNVRLLTETLSQELSAIDVPPRVRDRVGRIDVETAHLVQMVNELLDLTRIERGTTPLHFDEVDLAEVARLAIERLRLFGERQGVNLRLETPGSAPLVRGDAERLGQLLVNLLHNAVKFSDAGGEVVVAVLEEPDEVVVAVRDQGPGIPAEELGRIFERFYKVDKARVRGKGGTGLGLTIARHIADGHGGRIWVESLEGEGATFSFAIPRVDRVDRLAGAPDRLSGPASSPSRSRRSCTT